MAVTLHTTVRQQLLGNLTQPEGCNYFRLMRFLAV